MNLYDYEKKHIEALRSSLAECTVLLKKDGAFPLDGPCKLAAYGSGVRGTIKGGTGSGEVNSRYSINIEQGLSDAAFRLTTKDWLDSYDMVRKNAKGDFIKKLKAEAKAAHMNLIAYGMGKAMPEPEYELPLKADGDACIYVVSRISGEGNDRVIEGGDVKLTFTEVRDILTLNQKFEKFMLVLNVGGVVDLSPVLEVKNILVLSQLGVETGTTLANILLGKDNPSGKLATTWAAWEEYLPMPDFDEMDETRYKEGIYVGYRYFDTFNKKALFPFGFGLSYTEFEMDSYSVSNSGQNITVKASVKNTGNMAGKEVLQLYLSKPNGRLDQPFQELCAFAKTSVLIPGAKTEVEASFKLSDFAGYDEDKEAYVLEAGNYIVRAGNSSKSQIPVAVIKVEESVVILQAKNVLGIPDFTDMKSPLWKTNTPSVEEALLATLTSITLNRTDFVKQTVDYEKKKTIIPQVAELPLEKAALLTIGAFGNKKGIASIIGEASTKVCGAAGETESLGGRFPVLVMADGPAGLRLAREFYRDETGVHTVGQGGVPESFLDLMTGPMKIAAKLLGGGNKKPKQGVKVEEQYCTAIPIGTAIAQSFNLELAESYGDMVGEEMERFHVQLWLAPALNIHRSIRCGRNFEYYSEDPLISGLVAAAITKGVQKHKGCGTTIKHYAANNKEYNRYCNNSIVSERAMREIYTKGFGICVRESQPKAVMTSYNLLNGQHTAESRGLTEDILRAEYGYEGIVMTDWVIQMVADKRSANRNSLASHVIAAGGDIFMPGCDKDYKNLLDGVQKGIVTEEQVRISASHIIAMAEELADNN